jgi:hypothetical protein
MKAHGIFRAGAALALLGAFAGAEEQQNGFYAGLKLRGAFQAASREDSLMPVYLGFGAECGYQLGFGRLSAEVGFMYKAGRQYLDDLTKMEVLNGNSLNLVPGPNWSESWKPYVSVDSRKNQLDGITLRLSYEKPFDGFAVRGGLQLGILKFRQEYIGYLTGANWAFRESYNGVTDKGNLSVSPFVGISFPILTNHFVELNVVGVNYKSINYVHIAGQQEDWDIPTGPYPLDRISESSRFMPHIELTFGFRF